MKTRLTALSLALFAAPACAKEEAPAPAPQAATPTSAPGKPAEKAAPRGLPDFSGTLRADMLEAASRSMFELGLRDEAELAELRRVLGPPTFSALGSTAWGVDENGTCSALVHEPRGSKVLQFASTAAGPYKDCRTRLGIDLPAGEAPPEDGRTTPEVVRKNLVASKHAEWVGRKLVVSGKLEAIQTLPADSTKRLVLVDGATHKEELSCVVGAAVEVPSQGGDITVSGTLAASGALEDCALGGE